MTDFYGLGGINVNMLPSDTVSITIKDHISGAFATINLAPWDAMVFSEQIKETVLNGYRKADGDSSGVQQGNNSGE